MTNAEPITPVLDFRYYENPKTHAVGIAGRELHLRAICFSALHLTDGRLSHEGMVELALVTLASVSGTLVPPSRDDAERLVRSLVRHGLLDEAPGGYEIHDWLAFYPTRETVARRSRWRREKRTVRASADNRHSDGHTDQISGSSSVGLQPSASASVQRRADADEDQDPEQNGQKGNPEWFAQQLRGSDARTASAIRSVMRRHRLGEAALHEALEIVRERKPRNEPGYFVRCLQDIGERKAVA